MPSFRKCLVTLAGAARWIIEDILGGPARHVR